VVTMKLPVLCWLFILQVVCGKNTVSKDVSGVGVVFVVDMSAEEVEAGEGDHPAVFVSGVDIHGPTGLEMTDQGDGTWKLTTELEPGTHTFKFRNGRYSMWDGPGWESGETLFNEHCAFGEFNDRHVIVAGEPVTIGPFPFGHCGSGGDYELVWSDEFDGSEIDRSKWGFDIGTGNNGWGNNEAEYYTDRKENAHLSDGKLIITARKEDYESKKYTSARLKTKEKGDWTYGKVEVRAKIPFGDGTWPAIWMLPTDNKFGIWPNSGEIDIMEVFAFNPNHVLGTVHCEHYNWMNGNQKSGSIDNDKIYSEFHDYSIKWDEDTIMWFMDGTHYFTFENEKTGWKVWPFDERFHLLINLAIGGVVTPIDDSIFPVDYEIDYVRIYAKK